MKIASLVGESLSLFIALSYKYKFYVEFTDWINVILLLPFFFYKSLGKEVLLLMQALNTLSTPEEKLAALCKKYADLVSIKGVRPIYSIAKCMYLLDKLWKCSFDMVLCLKLYYRIEGKNKISWELCWLYYDIQFRIL